MNNNNPIWIIYLAVVVFMIWRCDVMEYKPSESHYTEIDQSNIYNPIINFFETEDSILLWKNVSIILTGDRKVFHYNAYIDGVFVGSANNYSRFDFDTRSYSDGFHRLKFELEVSTGTNSFADKLDLESIQITKEKVIEIDNSLPTAVQLNEPTWAGSIVNLSWSQNNDLNFQHYIVARYSNYYGTDGIDTLAYITDQSKTFFSDTLGYHIYGSNLGYYKILVEKHTGYKESNSQYISWGEPLEIFSYLFQAKPIPTKDGQIIYSFDKGTGDIAAVSVLTNQVLRRFTEGRYFTSYSLSKDEKTLTILSEFDDIVYVVDALNFQLIKEIGPIPQTNNIDGPIHAINNKLISLSYAFYGLYLLDVDSENQTKIDEPTLQSKFTSTEEGRFLYCLDNNWSNMNLYSYEILGDSAKKVNAIVLINHHRANRFGLQMWNDELLFVLHNSNSIDILNPENLEVINTIEITEIGNSDYILDFYVSNSFLFVSYTERKAFDLNTQYTYGKVVCFSLLDYSIKAEWYFKDTPFTIITDGQEEYLYGITAGAYKIAINN